MIEIKGLTKSFKGVRAIQDVSFTAEDGKVTGFLGPNGAGKSTTMRAALGLIAPDAGTALIDGRPFVDNPAPMRAVGAVLDAKSAHRSRTAYDHLLALALTNGIPRRRVDEVIAQTGLESVKRRKAGQFSLGMSQRLSIAAALLGDPRNLVLDEPINGLDPEGVRWVRELCRYYASQGRAVLLSSHLMSEVALTADNLVIIGRGRILRTTTVADFVAEHSDRSLRVVTPEPERLRLVFTGLVMPGTGGVNPVRIEFADRTPDDPIDGAVLRITGIDYRTAARAIAQTRLVVYAFAEEHASLEEAYMELTHSSVQYLTAPVPGAPPHGDAAGRPNAAETAAETVETDAMIAEMANQATAASAPEPAAEGSRRARREAMRRAARGNARHEREEHGDARRGGRSGGNRRKGRR